MEVITIESGLWQQLLNRIERIETYVKEATAPVNISDEDNMTFVCIISPDMVEEFFYDQKERLLIAAMRSNYATVCLTLRISHMSPCVR